MNLPFHIRRPDRNRPEPLWHQTESPAIGIQTAYLPAKRAPGLAGAGKPLVSLYATLRDQFGLVPQSALEVYRVGALSTQDAELLEVAAGSPAFIVQRTTSDARGPYEFTVSTMRGDRYEIRSRLRM